MTAADVRCAGRIMDSTNPFPSSEVSMATPLMWKVAVALGRATSLHPSCVYVHIMILIAHSWTPFKSSTVRKQVRTIHNSGLAGRGLAAFDELRPV